MTHDTTFKGGELEKYDTARGTGWQTRSGNYYTHDTKSGLINYWFMNGNGYVSTPINGGYHTAEQAQEQVEKDHLQRWS